jgi:hypothetical protein
MNEVIIIVGYYSLLPLVTLIYYKTSKWIFDKIDQLADEDDTDVLL